MTVVIVGILVAVCIGAAVLLWTRRGSNGDRTAVGVAPGSDATWAGVAGESFADLSEAARCDLVFAVAALDDDRSQQLLTRALDDPSEAVALAAAHALAKRGAGGVVATHFAGHPNERAQRIASALELLAD